MGDKGHLCPGLEASFRKPGSPGPQSGIGVPGAPLSLPITEWLSSEALSGEALDVVLNILLNHQTVLGPYTAGEEKRGSEASQDFLASRRTWM